MRLKILILLLHVALSESSEDVFGYVGDSVTLRSGADPSLKPTSIEWTIFSNSTFIATYRNGKINIDRFHQYIGRLHLNTTSGDLMIHNLTMKDDMNYAVVYISNGKATINRIKLTVRQRLQKPNIRTQIFLPSRPVRTGCWIEALCSSLDEGVEFSWEVAPSGLTMLDASLSGRSALLLAFTNSTQVPVNFTCITSKTMEKTQSVASSVCEDQRIQPIIQPQLPTRKRLYFVIAPSAFIGCLLTIMLFYFCGDQKQTATQQMAAVATGASASDAET